jgi:hypothetical protein
MARVMEGSGLLIERVKCSMESESKHKFLNARVSNHLFYLVFDYIAKFIPVRAGRDSELPLERIIWKKRTPQCPKTRFPVAQYRILYNK